MRLDTLLTISTTCQELIDSFQKDLWQTVAAYDRDFECQPTLPGFKEDRVCYLAKTRHGGREYWPCTGR